MHAMIVRKYWKNGKEEFFFLYGGKKTHYLRWTGIPIFADWEDYPEEFNPYGEEDGISAEMLWKSARRLGIEPIELLKKMINFSNDYKQEVQKIWIEEEED